MDAAGLWQIFYSLGIFASCRLLPRPTFWVAVFYLGTGLAVLALAHGEAALSPWAMGLPFGAGSIAGRRRAVSHLGARPWLRLKPKPVDAHRPVRLRRPGASLPRKGPARDHDVAGLQPAGVVFADLKEMCHLTDGNLSRHLQVLNEAGLVEIWKGFHKNRPQTLCRITDEGRRRFLEYINVLETVVHDAMNAAREREPAAAGQAQSRRGWSPA